jgi:hypothetical protein
VVDVVGQISFRNGNPVQCRVRAKPRTSGGIFRAAAGGRISDITDKSGVYRLKIETDQAFSLIVDDGGCEIPYDSLGFRGKNLKIDCEIDHSPSQRKLSLLRVIQEAAREGPAWNRSIPEGQSDVWVTVANDTKPDRIVVRVPREKATLLAVDYAYQQKFPPAEKFRWVDRGEAMDVVLPGLQVDPETPAFSSIDFLPHNRGAKWLDQWATPESLRVWDRSALVPVLRVSESRK